MTAPDAPGPGERTGRPVRPGSDEAAHTAALRRVLAVGAVAGLAFAALELRPAGGLLTGGGAPLNDEFGLVLLLALGWLVLLERTLRYYRTQVRHLVDLPPRAYRLREAAMRLIPLAAIGLPLVLLFLYPTAKHLPLPPLPAPEDSRSPRPLPTFQPPPPTRAGGHGLLGVLALGITILAVLAVLTCAVLVWRRLRRLPKPAAGHRVRRTRTDERELADAVASARRALLQGEDPRAAVIACYAAMEDSLADSGIERLIADSPTDLLDRAVTAGTLRGTDAGALTALFHEARFSRHPMDQTHLSRARAALDAIAEQLGEQAARAQPQDTAQRQDVSTEVSP
ncbi:hypothetical protein ABH930_001356 [Kitasatospora sp. GAS204A]|uniref:DUF4129 domain-containing protein n=1 Tax=unclassified Kitasatospora TaxID=2633591 RepID=UPI002474372D|nr:DUF4129 domain-containing protein [Kitasatospora sp. GAS204B]MDH6118356.1 hypothetical protein [Kitasatospora sp. GAS204B]